MPKVISAVVRHLDINQGQTDINIKTDGTDIFVYRAIDILGRGTAYLAQCGDIARFFFHDPMNESGFGGSVYQLPMEDGTIRTIKGPWSSNCSAINKLFNLEDPLVDCIENHCVKYATKSSLERVGVDLVWRNYGGGSDEAKAGYWEARRK